MAEWKMTKGQTMAEWKMTKELRPACVIRRRDKSMAEWKMTKGQTMAEWTMTKELRKDGRYPHV